MVMIDPEKSRRTPRFEPGAKVRVRSGVTVPDFEDIPLGGWTGTIKESDQPEIDEAVGNRKLVADYGYWFGNYG
jgi:hypothetical protein